VAALIVGAIAASPVVAYQIAAFLAPALHAHERRAVAVVTPLSLLLFLAGAGFGVLVLVPVALRFLYVFSANIGAEPLARPGDILGFVALTGMMMGLAFQLPLVMGTLSRFGVVSPRRYLRHWRGVIVGTLILAGIVTPDPTVTSQMLVAIPTLGLYALGTGLAFLVARRRGARAHVPAAARRP